MGRDVHPLVRRAADGVLPEWARAGTSRRAHMGRVAELLASWADRLRLAPPEKIRWRALGFLHDALRDAGEAELREIPDGGDDPSGGDEPAEAGSLVARPDPVWRVDWDAFRLFGDAPGHGPAGVPGGVLHGPAAALRIRDEGVSDVGVLSAVAYHTTGHPDFGAVGRALYCADFLEPGRPVDDSARAGLRDRYADDPEGVLRAVVRRRMRYLLEEDLPIFLGTVRMWNRANR